MTPAQWTQVDDYLCERLLAPDAVLDAALAASEAAGLPPIQVAPNQGKLLHLLALSIGARRVLEVGTLGGYSTRVPSTAASRLSASATRPARTTLSTTISPPGRVSVTAAS